MDRRFICRVCGLKWFIPASRPDVADLSACPDCGGPLERFADPAPGAYASQGEPAARRIER